MENRPNSPVRKWLFIGGFIVIAIVGFGLLFANRFSTEVNTLLSRSDQPEWVAVHYYEALRTQNYAAAYADFANNAALNGQSIDESTFIKLATEADTQQGKVFSYDLQAQDSTGFNATVRRGNQSYSVQLDLQQIGNIWRIATLTGI
jgi:hypothetical protein